MTTDVLHCANHPDRETALRCNKCGKPICARCARRTPTGYRCQDCVRQQQQKFETALWYDPVVAFAVSFVLSALAGALVTVVGFFVIFLAPFAGGALAQVVMAAVGRRRSKYLPWIAAGGAALGGLALCTIPTLSLAYALLRGGGGGLAVRGLLGGIWPIVYTVLCSTTVYYSLRGIRIG
jgi:hypothetical protein